MKQSKKPGRLTLALLILLALVLVLLLAGWFTYRHYIAKLNYQERDAVSAVSSETPPPMADETASEEQRRQAEEIDSQLAENLRDPGNADESEAQVTNILLIGVDNDNLPGLDELGNADGLVILSINKTTRQVVMTSLMRDIYVSVPNQFNTKLTLSYHYGGVPMLIDTIEANFGVPIDNYALVNYIDVVNIVDAFGGVEIDLREDEIYAMEGKIVNVNVLMGLDPSANAISQSQAGPITLNGVQTAAYLRVRMAGHGDYERTERARRVLGQLVEKARGMSVSELNDMADVVLPCITTDLTQGQILSLLVNAPQYMKYEMVSSRIPIEGSSYGADMNGYYLIVDYEVNREYLYNSIYNGVH